MHYLIKSPSKWYVGHFTHKETEARNWMTSQGLSNPEPTGIRLKSLCLGVFPLYNTQTQHYSLRTKRRNPAREQARCHVMERTEWLTESSNCPGCFPEVLVLSESWSKVRFGSCWNKERFRATGWFRTGGDSRRQGITWLRKMTVKFR